MQEFLDLRTLSINNILMSLSFAACMLIYSAYHPQFKGIKTIAHAFFMSSAAFLLIGFRSYIPDILSIVLSNILLVLSMALVHLGFVYFYQFKMHMLYRFHAVMLLALVILITYFTYYEVNVNARVAVISVIVGLQSLYIMATLLIAHNKANMTIAIFYLFFSAYFFTRAVLMLLADPLGDFMAGGSLNSLAIIIYEFFVAVTSFGIVWIVSYRVQRTLSEQASHDPLTKVLNRRALEDIINVEHARSVRNNTKMSIIMLDIDYFKRINDRFGHGKGDEILVDVADVLIKNTRKYDSIARFGGEEFIILLPDTNIEKAGVIAENLRIKIASNDYGFQLEDNIQVTASFGTTECDLEKDSWLKVLERADKSLYQAKSEGRNRVVVCDSNIPGAEILGAG